MAIYLPFGRLRAYFAERNQRAAVRNRRMEKAVALRNLLRSQADCELLRIALNLPPSSAVTVNWKGKQIKVRRAR